MALKCALLPRYGDSSGHSHGILEEVDLCVVIVCDEKTLRRGIPVACYVDIVGLC